MRILLVEGNVTAAQSLTCILQNTGFIVDHSNVDEEALEMLRHDDYDLAVIDLDRPNINGSDLVARMRHACHPVPTLILSSSVLASVRIQALAAGADDVVSKPFDRIELVARIQAILRRSKPCVAPVLRIANLCLNLNSRQVTVDERPVHLTSKEYSVLELLARHKGMVLTKDTFMNHLYAGMDEPEMTIIDTFISKLRKKMQLAGAGNLIGTIRGRGYMLRNNLALTVASTETVYDGSVSPTGYG